MRATLPAGPSLGYQTWWAAQALVHAITGTLTTALTPVEQDLLAAAWRQVVKKPRDFPVRNGRTNDSFEITPLSTLSCLGNQVVVIESVSYSGLTLTGPGGLTYVFP